MKPKVLFILPTLPYPLSAGGNQAMFNGINAIKSDVDIFVMCSVPFYNKRETALNKLCSILKEVQFVPFVYNPLKGFYNFILWLLFRITILFRIKQKNQDYYCSQMPLLFRSPLKEFANFVNDFVEKNSIDIVQFEMCSTLSQVLTLPSNVKKVFVHHELNYIVNSLRIKNMTPFPSRIANVELAKILELGLLNKCDAIITLSEIDMQKLIKDGVTTPIYPSFAIVNTDVTSCNSNKNGNILSFVGPSSHTPNYQGVKWFLENCWNRLLRQDASYRLKIIGYWSENRRNEIMQKFKNIEFTGFVPDLAEALNNTIMIVPITVGSGIRMKILEAACLGIPFVSTTVGAEGLPFENGKDCLKGDTPEEFVDAVLKMSDKSLRFEFAKNANALVKEKYSMDALRRNRLEIYKKVMES